MTQILTRPTKVIISFILSIISISLYLKFKNRERKACMFAMISSTLGDIFMTDIVGIGDFSTYPGATFFIIAHIIYAVCFIKAGKEKNYYFFNKGFIIGLILIIVDIVGLTFLMFKVTNSIQSMYFPLLLYMLFIGFNTISQFSYAYNEKGIRYMLMLAMFLFVVSDFLVFLPMLNIYPESPTYNDYIWFTYIPAQLFIILFNSNFIKEK